MKRVNVNDYIAKNGASFYAKMFDEERKKYIMATCPNCNFGFREPEGEEEEHDCPKCDYSSDEEEKEDEDRWHS